MTFVPAGEPAATDWDAIVIGAGAGGLSCAAYLAAGGRRVLVVEQHDVAGGNCHVFRRRRAYEFDVGVHYLGECGPDGLIPDLLRGLGAAGRVRFRAMDPDGFDQIVVPGVTFDVPRGWAHYRDRLVAAFPADAVGVDRCLSVFQAVLAAGAGAQPGAGVDVDMLAWGRRSLSELFDHCALSTVVRTVLAAQSGNYGLPPDGATVAEHARVSNHYLRDGGYYPLGGGQVLVATLVEVIEAHDGQVWTRCQADRILIEHHRVTGVALADGRVLRAPVVVSNADYRRTVLQLVDDPAAFPSHILDKARQASMRLPLAVLYIATDTPLPRRRNANLWWVRDPDLEAVYRRLRAGDLEKVDYLFCSFASLKDPDNGVACPPGHANFQLITPVPADYQRWGVTSGPADGTRYRRDPAYLREKHRLTERMLEAGESAIGPFREHITHLEMASPLSQERYLRSTGGTPYGMARWGTGIGSRPDVRTPVEGLYVVGQSIRHGSGVAGVMIGGVICAGHILGGEIFSRVRAGAVIGDPARLPERPPDWDPLVVSRGAGRRLRHRSGTSLLASPA